MSTVLTPDGWGQVLGTETTRGRTSYLVKGAGFEGWYDGLQVEADFKDQPDEVIPNDNNDTTLPYPSRPQGPGWPGDTSTIQPGTDPNLETDGNSSSLTGEPSSEDAVGADLDGLFQAHSRVAGVRHHHSSMDDPILDVSALPGESPTGLENSPINPDGVSTDDLFNGDNGFGRAASYDRLVIEDSLSFLRYAAEGDSDCDDKKEKNHHERSGMPPWAGDDDDDSDDDGGDDSDGDSDGDSGSDGGDGGGDGGGHTASFSLALSTTADLHFLANMCRCAEEMPLHSKTEHRELEVEAAKKRKKKSPLGSKPLTGKHDANHGPKTPGEAGYTGKGVAETIRPTTKGTKKKKVERPIHYAETINGITPQEQDLDKLLERYQQDNFNHQESNLDDLVDRTPELENGDGADLYNKLAAAAEPPAPTQIESQIEQLMQFWATDSNNWWHWTGSQADLALLNQMQQQMAAVGAPTGQPGQMQAQGFVIEANTPEPWREYLQVLASDRLVALAAWSDVVQKSKRLRSEGAVVVEAFRPDVITAHIQGDNGRYYTTVQRLGSIAPGVGRQLTSTQVSGWSCECDWGHWAWLRKRSFVGRMCSHAYALFSEMRSLDAKRRRGAGNGKPVGGGQSLSSVSNGAAWNRTSAGFSWVTSDPTVPTAFIAKTASGWTAQVWSDGTADDSLNLGSFQHSEQARRAVGRVVNAHMKLAVEGDFDLVGDDNASPFTAEDEDGVPEAEQTDYDMGPGPGIQESRTRVGSSDYTYASLFAEAEAMTGDDNEGPESDDDGIEEEEPDDDESLDEEIARDEADADGDEGESEPAPEPESDDDGGHEEPHKRDDSDDDDGEGTDNPGDESDDEGIEKESSVADLQARFGLTHLAGKSYSLAEQNGLVHEGDGKTARNHSDLNLTGTHYEASVGSVGQSPEDTLAFLF